MFSKKEKSEESKFTNMILRFVVILTAVAMMIVLVFRGSPYGNQLTIGDYLGFAGDFGGAILGAMMSLMILAITLNKQKKDLEDQRQIDSDARKEEKERYIYMLDYIKMILIGLL